MAAAHVDATANPEPGSRGYLKWYWTKGPGLKKWAASTHPWTTLRTHLARFLTPEIADRTASQWFHDVFGIWPGERKGKNPAGRG
ncbi:hypothetical protein JRG19_02510 [Pseudoclavibacter alba]|uniref:hypothetical protein n=1 Tax=Pseudoclavibacter albus TaxID=272241 RepID=UPI0019D25BA6|nr:hypothetical protein [Pseudoclavibacter alba]MBN6777422.1 hypothetical protein [Pseudoclavibacter alba]